MKKNGRHSEQNIPGKESTTFSLDYKRVLITGGTGSMGRSLAEYLLQKYQDIHIVIFSRDEHKQWEMAQSLDHYSARLTYFGGDIRDKNSLIKAFERCDVVIHTAGLKHIPFCETNSFEAIQTNIIGTQNVIEAAITARVKKALITITDKAVIPTSLYGATKCCAEKLFINANNLYHNKGTKFACSRWGNIIDSRGGVLSKFFRQRHQEELTITDEHMTRFWMTLDQVATLTDEWITKMYGGEIFLPKCQSARVVDLARAIAPHAKLIFTGRRPGEKLHEEMFSAYEAARVLDFHGYFLIRPEFDNYWNNEICVGCKHIGSDFRYSSDQQENWFTSVQLKKLIGQYKKSDYLSFIDCTEIKSFSDPVSHPIGST